MTEPAPTCPSCAGDDVTWIGRLPDAGWFAGVRLERPLPGGSLFRCAGCMLKFRHPVQAGSVYDELYDNAATTTWAARGSRPDWDLICRYITDRLPAGARVLDYGCYTGGFLARLGSRYRRYGVEVNRAAAAIASRSVDGPVCASLDEIPPDRRFEAVVAADVVEHMADPLTFVQRITSKLSRGSVLIMTTGDADNVLWNRFGANWWYCYYPEHLTFISQAWLANVPGLDDLSVECCDTFRYRRLNGLRWLVDGALTCCYGWFPGPYLAAGAALKSLLRRRDGAGVPGAGVSRDHLFIVLRKGRE